MRTMIIVQPSYPGLLAEVTGLLAANEINIIDISGQAVGDNAVISIRVGDYRTGYRVLSEAGYHVYANETLLVRVTQERGALARLSQRLADAGIDVRGLHIVSKDGEAGIVALETTHQDMARDLLRDQLGG